MTAIHKYLVLAMALGGITLPAHNAFADEWERLGCTTVSFNVDKDVIEVGKKDGSYKRIKLRVKSAPIEFYELRVVFGNGDRQNISIQQVVQADSESRPIDLKGVDRGIDRIELLYRSIPTFEGKAEVCITARAD